MKNNTASYLKAAQNVAVGETVVDADGFTWTVTKRESFLKTVKLSLAPVMASITARQPRTVSFSRSASVRVAGDAVEPT